MAKASDKRLKIIMLVLTGLTISFALVHSMIPASVSTLESTAVYEIVFKIFKFFGFGADLTEHIVRKAAHFSEFCAIGFLSTGCAYAFCKTRPSKYTVQVFFTGLATAVCDETIQLNVPGRAGMITDVLIDFSGVLTGFVIALIYFWIYRKIKRIR